MSNYGVVGATGETGREIIRHLCLLKQSHPTAVSKVTCFGRKPLTKEDCFHRESKQEDKQVFEALSDIFEKTVEHVTVNFEDLAKDMEANAVESETSRVMMRDCHVGISCLGTTHAKAGSNSEFRRIEYNYIVGAARCAERAGAKRFLVVSALGANPKTRFNYLKTKGEIDDAIAKMKFDVVGVFRPGTLLCDRRETRPAEAMLRMFSKLDKWNWTSIQTADVAAGMVYFAQAPVSEIQASIKGPTSSTQCYREVYMADNVKLAAKFAKLAGRSLSKRLSRSLNKSAEDIPTAPGSVATINEQ